MKRSGVVRARGGAMLRCPECGGPASVIHVSHDAKRKPPVVRVRKCGRCGFVFLSEHRK